MKRFTNQIFAGLGAIALLVPAASAAPTPEGQSYHLIDLGALPGKKESTPAAINNAGAIAGFSTAEPLTEAAFRYNPVTGALDELGAKPVGSLTRAFGLNDDGQAVGDSTFGPISGVKGAPIRTAAIFSKGSSAALGRNNKTDRYSRATDINNTGMVVGFAGPTEDGHDTHAFAWSEAAGMFDLGTLGGAYAQALAINDAGFVTGHAEVSDGLKGGAKHAFLAQVSPSGATGKLMIDLGTLGGSYSYGTAISEKGHVVGYSTMSDAVGSFHAFLYQGGQMQDIGSLAQDDIKTDQSFAFGVNRDGQVVGYAFLPLDQAVEQVGFIYQAGKMQDLNQLIGPAAKRYLIYAATAINDNGQIAATAFDHDNNVFRAVVLTPVGLAGLK